MASISARRRSTAAAGPGAGGEGEGEGEGVALDASGQVLGAQRAADGGGHGGQHLVPGQVAVAVVEPAEALDVEHGQAERVAVPAGRAHGGAQPLQEGGRGGEAGQRIVRALAQGRPARRRLVGLHRGREAHQKSPRLPPGNGDGAAGLGAQAPVGAAEHEARARRSPAGLRDRGLRRPPSRARGRTRARRAGPRADAPGDPPRPGWRARRSPTPAPRPAWGRGPDRRRSPGTGGRGCARARRRGARPP